jgi:ankyrin repeat protein
MGVDPNHELTRMRPNGNGRIRFEEYMMRGGATAVLIAAMAYDTEALRALIAHHAAVDVPNVFQITPLMAAAGMSGSGRGNFTRPPPGDVQARALPTIDLLLDAGASINTRVTRSRTYTAKLHAYVQGRDHEGQTALFAAAEGGWDRVVKHLLERGADATVHDAAGKTALDFAKTPPPPGPGAGGAPAGGFARAADAARAATVEMLTPLTARSGVSGEGTGK